MGLEFKIQRKVDVKSRTFPSLDEVPPELRDIVNKAIASAGRGKSGSGHTTVSTQIVFNGVKYGSVEEMPDAARLMYQVLAQEVPADGSTARKSPGMVSEMGSRPANAWLPVILKGLILALALIGLLLLYQRLFG